MSCRSCPKTENEEGIMAVDMHIQLEGIKGAALPLAVQRRLIPVALASSRRRVPTSTAPSRQERNATSRASAKSIWAAS